MSKLLIILALATPAFSANFFFSQSGGGAGTSCGSTFSAAQFNANVSSWAVAGNTAHLCGTITSALVVPASGASGNPITIQWEAGTSLQACSTGGDFQIPGLSNLVIDLGLGNSASITCPNNGDGLTTSIDGVVGISDSTSHFDHVEIRNGTIGPLYQHTYGLNTGTHGNALGCQGNCSNNRIHNVTFADAPFGIQYIFVGPGASSGNEIDHNTVTRVGSWLYYADGDGSNRTDTNGLIHDNDVTFGDNWNTGAANAIHLEMIHVFNQANSSSAADKINNLYIYNNYFHGCVGCGVGSSDTTAYVFISEGALSGQQGTSSVSAAIFNNLFVMTGGTGPGDGFIFEQDGAHNLQVYNNTFDGGNNTIGMCLEVEGVPSTIRAANNLCMNLDVEIYNANTTGPTLTGWSNNDYFNVGTTGVSGWVRLGTDYLTLATWQANCVCGGDANSISSNPNVNASYVPQSPSPVIAAGINLTNLCSTIPQLCQDKAGVLRPPTAGWDIGTFQSNSCLISPTALGPWTIGQVISQTFTQSGCPASQSWTSTGIFPTGLTFTGGVISSASLSGTVGGSSGTFTPSVMYNVATNPYSIVVNPAPSISTSSPLPSATQGSVYSQTLAIAGGTGSSTCSITAGSLVGSSLVLASNCIVTGTAGTPGVYNFTVAPTDTNNVTGTPKAFQLTVNSASNLGGHAVGGSVVIGGKANSQ